MSKVTIDYHELEDACDTMERLKCFAFLIDDALEYSPNSAIEYSGAISIFTDLMAAHSTHMRDLLKEAAAQIDVEQPTR